MKNNRLLALLIVCGVLDWWMVSSHRSRPEEPRVIEVAEPVITVAKHEAKKKAYRATNSRHIRVC